MRRTGGEEDDEKDMGAKTPTTATTMTEGSWMLIGISWLASRGSPGGSFEASWASFWGLLGPLGGLLGLLGGPVGRPLGSLGGLLGPRGGFFGSSWGFLGAS